MADSSNRGSNLREKARETSGAATQTIQSAKGAAQEATHQAAQKAQDFGANVAERARDLASTAGDKTENAMSAVGQQMTSLAGTIRQNAPHEGYVGSAASAVAEGLQSGGRYLQDHGLNDIADDLNSLVRSHPVGALGVAFGVGWLFGMFSRR